MLDKIRSIASSREATGSEGYFGAKFDRLFGQIISISVEGEFYVSIPNIIKLSSSF